MPLKTIGKFEIPSLSILDENGEVDSKLEPKLSNEKLIEIQENGYYWTNLPEPQGPTRLKTEWVPYKPQ